MIKASGRKPIVHIAKDEEYLKRLYKKLVEESVEFKKKPSNEEIVDVLEVVYAIASFRKLSRKKLESLRLKKARTSGGFSKKIVLDKIIE